MARRTKFIIAGVLATVLVLGVIGGIALANTSRATTTTGKPLIAKVATILGIDLTKVQSAFDQAQKELQSEALDKWLANAVSGGKIKQAQDDQYKEWLNSKPVGLDQMGPDSGMMKWFGGSFGHGCFRPPAANGSITN